MRDKQPILANANVTTVMRALAKRLSDVQYNTRPRAAAAIAAISRAVGPSILTCGLKHVASDLLGCLSDKKGAVKDAAINALDALVLDASRLPSGFEVEKTHFAPVASAAAGATAGATLGRTLSSTSASAAAALKVKQDEADAALSAIVSAAVVQPNLIAVIEVAAGSASTAAKQASSASGAAGAAPTSSGCILATAVGAGREELLPWMAKLAPGLAKSQQSINMLSGITSHIVDACGDKLPACRESAAKMVMHIARVCGTTSGSGAATCDVIKRELGKLKQGQRLAVEAIVMDWMGRGLAMASSAAAAAATLKPSSATPGLVDEGIDQPIDNLAPAALASTSTGITRPATGARPAAVVPKTLAAAVPQPGPGQAVKPMSSASAALAAGGSAPGSEAGFHLLPGAPAGRDARLRSFTGQLQKKYTSLRYGVDGGSDTQSQVRELIAGLRKDFEKANCASKDLLAALFATFESVEAASSSAKVKAGIDFLTQKLSPAVAAASGANNGGNADWMVSHRDLLLRYTALQLWDCNGKTTIVTAALSLLEAIVSSSAVHGFDLCYAEGCMILPVLCDKAGQGSLGCDASKGHAGTRAAAIAVDLVLLLRREKEYAVSNISSSVDQLQQPDYIVDILQTAVLSLAMDTRRNAVSRRLLFNVAARIGRKAKLAGRQPHAKFLRKETLARIVRSLHEEPDAAGPASSSAAASGNGSGAVPMRATTADMRLSMGEVICEYACLLNCGGPCAPASLTAITEAASYSPSTAAALSTTTSVPKQACELLRSQMPVWVKRREEATQREASDQARSMSAVDAGRLHAELDTAPARAAVRGNGATTAGNASRDRIDIGISLDEIEESMAQLDDGDDGHDGAAAGLAGSGIHDRPHTEASFAVSDDDILKALHSDLASPPHAPPPASASAVSSSAFGAKAGIAAVAGASSSAIPRPGGGGGVRAVVPATPAAVRAGGPGAGARPAASKPASGAVAAPPAAQKLKVPSSTAAPAAPVQVNLAALGHMLPSSSSTHPIDGPSSLHLEPFTADASGLMVSTAADGSLDSVSTISSMRSALHALYTAREASTAAPATSSASSSVASSSSSVPLDRDDAEACRDRILVLRQCLETIQSAIKISRGEGNTSNDLDSTISSLSTSSLMDLTSAGAAAGRDAVWAAAFTSTLVTNSPVVIDTIARAWRVLPSYVGKQEATNASSSDNLLLSPRSRSAMGTTALFASPRSGREVKSAADSTTTVLSATTRSLMRDLPHQFATAPPLPLARYLLACIEYAQSKCIALQLPSLAKTTAHALSSGCLFSMQRSHCAQWLLSALSPQVSWAPSGELAASQSLPLSKTRSNNLSRMLAKLPSYSYQNITNNGHSNSSATGGSTWGEGTGIDTLAASLTTFWDHPVIASRAQGLCFGQLASVQASAISTVGREGLMSAMQISASPSSSASAPAALAAPIDAASLEVVAFALCCVRDFTMAVAGQVDPSVMHAALMQATKASSTSFILSFYGSILACMAASQGLPVPPTTSTTGSSSPSSSPSPASASSTAIQQLIKAGVRPWAYDRAQAETEASAAAAASALAAATASAGIVPATPMGARGGGAALGSNPFFSPTATLDFRSTTATAAAGAHGLPFLTPSMAMTKGAGLGLGGTTSMRPGATAAAAQPAPSSFSPHTYFTSEMVRRIGAGLAGLAATASGAVAQPQHKGAVAAASSSSSSDSSPQATLGDVNDTMTVPPTPAPASMRTAASGTGVSFGFQQQHMQHSASSSAAALSIAPIAAPAPLPPVPMSTTKVVVPRQSRLQVPGSALRGAAAGSTMATPGHGLTQSRMGLAATPAAAGGNGVTRRIQLDDAASSSSAIPSAASATIALNGSSGAFGATGMSSTTSFGKTASAASGGNGVATGTVTIIAAPIIPGWPYPAECKSTARKLHKSIASGVTAALAPAIAAGATNTLSASTWKDAVIPALLRVVVTAYADPSTCAALGVIMPSGQQEGSKAAREDPLAAHLYCEVMTAISSGKIGASQAKIFWTRLQSAATNVISQAMAASLSSRAAVGVSATGDADLDQQLSMIDHKVYKAGLFAVARDISGYRGPMQSTGGVGAGTTTVTAGAGGASLISAPSFRSGAGAGPVLAKPMFGLTAARSVNAPISAAAPPPSKPSASAAVVDATAAAVNPCDVTVPVVATAAPVPVPRATPLSPSATHLVNSAGVSACAATLKENNARRLSAGVGPQAPTNKRRVSDKQQPGSRSRGSSIDADNDATVVM